MYRNLVGRVHRFGSSYAKAAGKKMGDSIKKVNRENIVWMDLEMTGLDVDRDKILEIACVITDPHLNLIAEGPDIIIHQDDVALNSMGEWCTAHHADSGLTEASRKSTVSTENAEKEILSFLAKHTAPGSSPLAGNSIYMDRIFLRKYMPLLDSYLNYRLIDVSTVKELCKRWHPKIYHMMPEKVLAHRSLSDIKESINELKYYKDNIFVD